MAKAAKTILKWAGSKVRIIEQLRPHLPKAKRLVEPFAGSCAVMMNTDYEQYLIADVNSDLINFYLTAQALPVQFIPNAEYYFQTFNQSNSYYDIRKKFNTAKKDMTPEEMAVNFLYLNRHCYNGLCRYSEKTGFNVPFGNYKKPYFPKKEIIDFAVKSQDIIITCLEWQDTLSLVDFNDGVYCDPPYMGSGFTQYHTAGFSDADNEALAIALKDINDIQGNPITVSNSPEATELYADLGFTIHEIDAPRTISAKDNRKPAKEIIAVLKGVK
ncbi:Dam family site-specific DNA-(adenine-N6)-methyltransferase [Providencia stuartii]|uniref:DNA adenine methylase n=1 Tax=Providencia stuartii TaxID=588 RepID=UPI000EF9408E|nr:Dam family site-specific DNA-(adenine-N6)-methyltransferase [Providencia stuartii]RMA08729.1 Dam family site-specific DNA-(adenine-N6)-methyltransferase [Providencia stuartii]